MLSQRFHILERICAFQLTGVDDAHEEVTDTGALWGLVEQGVFAMQDGPFQDPFTDAMPRPGSCRARAATSRSP